MIRPHLKTKIVGGKQAESRDYPWMVAVLYAADFIGGGSIINSNYVLTAAHLFLG